MGLQCANDCSTLVTCIGQTTPVFSKACGSINPQTPYCVNNICSAEPDPNNKECNFAFPCTAEGIFPDPRNCTKYHFCDGIGIPSVSYECPPGYVFQSTTKLCRRQDSPAHCETVDCTNSSNAMVLFKPHPAYYAFCMAGPIAPIYMYKCLDELNEIYDLATNKCAYNCLKQGSFKDRTNCRGYIVCSMVNGLLVGTKAQCPPGNYFNGEQCVRELNLCVSEISIPDEYFYYGSTQMVVDRTSDQELEPEPEYL